MQWVQKLPTNRGTKAAAYEEYAVLSRCPECRGHLVQTGVEVACTSCGVVAQSEQPVARAQTTNRSTPSRRLGSYMGRKEDENSTADFNGVSTVGFAKLLSDHMGEDQTARNCEAIIRRVADRLSLPTFAKENAVGLSEKMLACIRNNQLERHRTSVSAISAYSVLSACRAAGLVHISSRSVIRAHVDMGHKVTKSSLLRLGTESPVPIRPADPTALLRTVMSGLESNGGVLQRLRKKGAEPGPYFRRLLQASLAIIGVVRSIGEGRSPRTLAAGTVYLASREVGPKAVTQKEVAETLGVAEYTVREFVATVSRELGLGPLKGGSP